MRVQQLQIDVLTKDGITKELYNKIVKMIEENDAKVMDDCHGPYTEDMSHYYTEEMMNDLVDAFGDGLGI